MKEQILNWLKYDRTFNVGIQLYIKYGFSLSLKASLNRQGETEYNNQLVRDELAKIAGIPPDELKAIISIPVHNYRQEEKTPDPVETKEPVFTTVEEVISNVPEAAVKAIRLRDEFPFLNEEDCPNELKILVADMISAYERYRKAHEALFTAETETQLLESSKQAVEDYLQNRLIWTELNHYKENHEVLGEHPMFAEVQLFTELNSLSGADLSKKKGNVRSQITRLNKAINDPKNVEKLHLLTEKLASNERILAEIERLLKTR